MHRSGDAGGPGGPPPHPAGPRAIFEGDRLLKRRALLFCLLALACADRSLPPGGGLFGTWSVDETGLPQFEYTLPRGSPLGLYRDARGLTSRLHWYGFGNDRLVALGTSEGSAVVWDGGAGGIWLDALDNGPGGAGGGIGILEEGGRRWGTLRPMWPPGSEGRIRFGAGRYEVEVADRGLVVTHDLAAAPGDAPALVARVRFHNLSDRRRDLSYTELWGINLEEIFPFEAERDRKSRSARLVPSSVPATDARVLRVIPPAADPGQVPWGGIDLFLAPLGAGGGAGCPSIPPIDLPMYAAVQPAAGGRACLTSQQGVSLPPGATAELHFVFGYAPTGGVEAALDDPFLSLPDPVTAAAGALLERLPRVVLPRDPFLARELPWDAAALLALVSWDEAHALHTLTQGGYYQFLWGTYAALRDPLQEILPLVWIAPSIARDVLQLTLEVQTLDGELPYYLSGRGEVSPPVVQPSDQGLFLLLAAITYVNATRDLPFLDRLVPYADAPAETVDAHLARTFRNLRDRVGLGAHGLLRIRTGDWNDVIVQDSPTPALTTQEGESTFNTAMAAAVLPAYLDCVQRRGEAGLAAEVAQFLSEQRTALAAQWTGRAFNRGWLGGGKELGGSDGNLFLEPQAWALRSGVPSPDEARTLLASIDSVLDAPSPLGAMQESKPDPTLAARSGEHGGIWPALLGPLVEATALLDPEWAWRELGKMTLEHHADLYPAVWYGIWAGPDFYNSPKTDHPGETTGGGQYPGLSQIGFPVLDAHVHAWPLEAALTVLGLGADARGYVFEPNVPFDAFRVETPLAGLGWAPTGAAGYAAPATGGALWIRVARPRGLVDRSVVLTIAGVANPAGPGSDPVEGWVLASPGDRIDWSLTLSTQ